jgi:putative FmdB family regulatory protein
MELAILVARQRLSSGRNGGTNMPTYEYICSGCGKKFDVIRTFSEHDKGRVACPKCKSRKVAQRFSAVFTKTSRKS